MKRFLKSITHLPLNLGDAVYAIVCLQRHMVWICKLFLSTLLDIT